MKPSIQTAASRLRAAWGVLTSKRSIVITYNPSSSPNNLDFIYLCAPSQEVPARLANATRLAFEWDRLDSHEGQENALVQAKTLLYTQSDACH